MKAWKFGVANNTNSHSKYHDIRIHGSLLFVGSNIFFSFAIRYGSVVDRCLTLLVLESVTFTGNSLRFQITLKAILSEGYVRLNSFLMDGKQTNLFIFVVSDSELQACSRSLDGRV